jgi:hypothetical protein
LVTAVTKPVLEGIIGTAALAVITFLFYNLSPDLQRVAVGVCAGGGVATLLARWSAHRSATNHVAALLLFGFFLGLIVIEQSKPHTDGPVVGPTGPTTQASLELRPTTSVVAATSVRSLPSSDASPSATTTTAQPSATTTTAQPSATTTTAQPSATTTTAEPPKLAKPALLSATSEGVGQEYFVGFVFLDSSTSVFKKNTQTDRGSVRLLLGAVYYTPDAPGPYKTTFTYTVCWKPDTARCETETVTITVP